MVPLVPFGVCVALLLAFSCESSKSCKKNKQTVININLVLTGVVGNFGERVGRIISIFDVDILDCL